MGKPLDSILAALAIFLVSCSTKPFIVEIQGKPATAEKAEKPPMKIFSLGFSILTKSKTETAAVELPDGTRMSHSVTGKNEVSVPNSYIAGQVTENLADIAAGVTNTTTAAGVSKASISADVSKTQIEADKAVNLLKAAPVQ
jgi:hypothetical protein